jgi:hypothetical protein
MTVVFLGRVKAPERVPRDGLLCRIRRLLVDEVPPQVFGGEDNEERTGEAFVCLDGFGERGATVRIGQQPQHERIDTEAFVLDAAGSAPLVQEALADEGGQRLGGAVDLEEVVVFVFVGAGCGIEVGFENLLGTGATQERSPVRWFRLDAQELEVPFSGQLFELDADVDDGQRVSEEIGRGFEGALLLSISQRSICDVGIN